MLDLSDKNLAYMDDCIVELMTQPTDSDSINLSNNDIENINLNIIPDKFRVINLSNNNISKIELVNINRCKIDLSHNRIGDIIINNVQCEYLDISNNNIRNITFNDCIIETLDLNTNLVDTIIFNNTTIKNADLSFNKIKFLDSYPNQIENLNLFSNKLFDITNMPNTIAKFDLGNNKLRELNYISTNLTSLDVSNNKLSDFNINMLPEYMTYFDITENNIKNTNIFKNLVIHTCLYDLEKSDESSNLDTSKRNICKIKISDDSEEWDDNASADSVSDDTSEDNESDNFDIIKFIQETHNEKNKRVDEDVFDDEISRALQEYKEKIKESEEIEDKKREMLFSKSKDIFDFLKDSSSEDSDYPQYETYQLRWDIVI